MIQAALSLTVGFVIAGIAAYTLTTLFAGLGGVL